MGGDVTTSGLFIFVLGAMVSTCAALLLLRTYRRDRKRLLFWSSVCFGLLALDNAETLLDYVTPPWFDLTIPRTATALVAVGIMLYGVMWERR